MSEGQRIYETMRSLARQHDEFEAMLEAYLKVYPQHRSLYNIKEVCAEAWAAQAQARAKLRAADPRS